MVVASTSQYKARSQREQTCSSPDKPPLVDRFGRVHDYLRVSVTERCNLRCRYCMPPEGVPLKPRETMLRYEEIERLVRLMARMGVRKVRLTGGEPMARKGLVSLVRSLAEIEGIETLAMTTNGMNLAQEAAGLREAGLNALNVSLDTLRPDRFRLITLREGLENVLAGIQEALLVGFAPLKVNIVVMGGVNEDEILDFVEWGAPQPIELRFIEYMPFEGNRWEAAKFVPYQRMLDAIRERHELVPLEEAPSAVSRDYRIEGSPGRIGFIASMTASFCSGCSRLRLTSDGAIKNCLFHNSEINLRDAMRNGADDDALEEIIRGAVAAKPKEHPPMEELARSPNRAMIQIGG